MLFIEGKIFSRKFLLFRPKTEGPRPQGLKSFICSLSTKIVLVRHFGLSLDLKIML